MVGYFGNKTTDAEAVIHLIQKARGRYLTLQKLDTGGLEVEELFVHFDK